MPPMSDPDGIAVSSSETPEPAQSSAPPKAAAPLTTTPLPLPAPIQSKVTALVVDDEPFNRDFVVRLLQQAKLEVRGAEGGEEALAIVEELGDQIKLIMLDYQLRGQSGPELLKILRARLPNAKIVMATMHDERSLIRDAFEIGCTAYLVKPHGFMELYHLITEAVSAERGLDCLNDLIFDQYGSRPWRRR